MAAHTLTLIDEMLTTPITAQTCRDIANACNTAPGFDIPALENTEWEMLYDAAQSADLRIVEHCLRDVRKQVAYQAHYRTLEHLRAARMEYVQHETSGWHEREKAFAQLPAAEHLRLATVALALK